MRVYAFTCEEFNPKTLTSRLKKRIMKATKLIEEAHTHGTKIYNPEDIKPFGSGDYESRLLLDNLMAGEKAVNVNHGTVCPGGGTGKVGDKGGVHEKGEVYFGVSGEADVYLDGVPYLMKQGTLIYIPGGCYHFIVNTARPSLSFCSPFGATRRTTIPMKPALRSGAPLTREWTSNPASQNTYDEKAQPQGCAFFVCVWAEVRRRAIDDPSEARDTQRKTGPKETPGALAKPLQKEHDTGAPRKPPH